jgi:3-dehydroquinate synthase
MQKNYWSMAKKNEDKCLIAKTTEDVFDEKNSVLADALKQVSGEEPRVFLVADANVVNRTDGLGKKIGRYVQAHGIRLAGSPLVISGGEKIKADNFQSVMTATEAMLESRLGCNDTVLVLGGGSVLDVAGYAAAQVRGGVKIVRMPTTVASMVDSAFSHTAAVDSVNVKDAMRVSCVPSAVIVDTLFAKTVLDGVWRGGISAVVRMGAVLDAPLMKKLAKLAGRFNTRDYEAMAEIVNAAVAVRLKKGCSEFSDWSAFRLESMSAYKLPHGYATAIAVCIDAAYAVDKGYLKSSDQEVICGVLAECGALDGLQHSRHLLSQPDSILLGLDAWRLSHGSEAIELPSGIGRLKVEESPDREALRRIITEFREESEKAQ